MATLALLGVTLRWHATPLYGVETDLLGDTVPAARALRQGHITPGTFLFRGPGYPLMVAAGTLVTGGDEFLAARLLNVVAAAAAAGAAYLMLRAFLGPPAALVVMAALLANPVFVRNTLEAGSDMPALALGLVATWLVTGGGGWRSAAAAGLVSGFAYLTRYNMVFLAPAAFAALLVARAEGPRLVAYVAGFAVPVAAWVLAHLASTGILPANQNYLNVAYEVYGEGMGYYRFWVHTGNAFGSFADVALHDPARFALHLGRNAVTRWIADATQLMPVWIGTLALPGMLLTWWRRPGWAALAIHAGLAYLILTLVFYVPRFFLYLLPFYLSGTFGLLLRAQLVPPAGAGSWTRDDRGWLRLAGPVLAAVLIVLSAIAAAGEARKVLSDPPEETRTAGELLRTIGRPGERVMARKPHVAWFAGMEYVPIPYTETFTDFLAEADKAGTDYLFISPIEVDQYQQLSVLADAGVSLPGLVPLARREQGDHSFALYHRVPTDAPVATVEDSLLAAIRRFAERRPGLAFAQTYLGGHLVTMGRYREALAPLAEAERLDPDDPLVARFQAIAHNGLGESDAAAAACERALRRIPGGTWEWAFLGQIRIDQGRAAEAREALQRAMNGEPANPRYPILYLKACALGGYWEDAASVAQRVLAATPGDATARLIGARALLRLGRPERARALVEMEGPVSGPDSAAWAALADSIRMGVTP